MKDSRELALCEDIVRRWPIGQEESSHQEPNPAVLDLTLPSFQSPGSVDHPFLLEASLLWLLSPFGFSPASLELLTLPIHWDAELKGHVAIHRIKAKSGREAVWGFTIDENLGSICHDEWDSKEKPTLLEIVYCIMQFPLFVTISPRAFKKTDTI